MSERDLWIDMMSTDELVAILADVGWTITTDINPTNGQPLTRSVAVTPPGDPIPAPDFSAVPEPSITNFSEYAAATNEIIAAASEAWTGVMLPTKHHPHPSIVIELLERVGWQG